MHDSQETRRVRAAIYARQSKDRLQGIAAQLADCAALCRLRGYDVTTTITDNDVSATSTKKRPGYTRLLEMTEGREIDVIVVTHVDRLLRKLAALEELIELSLARGVAIVTVSGDLDMSNDAGRTVGRILAVVARGEVERKSARQMRANEAAATEGKPRLATHRPFGWRPDRVTLDETEAAAIRDACTTILRGGTVTGIMRDWIRRELRPPQAPYGPLPADLGWRRNSIRDILTAPRVAGISAYKDIELSPGQWEPVVSEETLRAVQWTLAQRARPGRSVTSLLGHLALCQCGNYVSSTVTRRGKPGYRCNRETRNGRPGPHVDMKREPVDEYISAAAVAFLSRPGAAEQLLAPEGADTAALRDEETVVQVRLQRLGALFMDGVITEADLTSGRARGEQRLAEIRAQLAAAGRVSVLTPLVMAGSVTAEWEALSITQRRVVIAALMTVTLHPTGPRQRFDAEAVLPTGRGIVWKEQP